LLDTDVLSDLAKREPDKHVLRWLVARNVHELFISAMTWGEL
jgi:predicted nucleic acid-binding protein